MAGSASESSNKVDNELFSLKHISGSLPSFFGFLVGFCAKDSSESDSERSPTSLLEFSVLSHFSNLLSARSPIRSFQSSPGKKCNEKKVGLCIVHSLADEVGWPVKDSTLLRRESIVFGPQVKRHCAERLDRPLKSSSLPKNYSPSSLPWITDDRSESSEIKTIHGGDGESLNSECFRNICSSSSTTEHPRLNSKGFIPEDKTSEDKTSSPVVIGRVSQFSNLSAVKPSSLPVGMISSNRNGISGPFSACDMKLFEDYTCIISHGANPKTTHIFGDCILEGQLDEWVNSDQMEEQGTNSPLLLGNSDGSSSYPSNYFSTNCHWYKKMLQKGDEICVNRESKAFGSTKSTLTEALPGRGRMKTLDNIPCKTLSNSICDEGFFLMEF